jgi:hypothetical protein
VSRETKCLVEKISDAYKHTQKRAFGLRLQDNTFQFVSANMSNSLQSKSTSSYFYFPHVTKKDYDQAFNCARTWALEHPDEASTTAARIYHVKELALRKSVCRHKQKQRNNQGVYNTWGGNHKILNKAQEEAIRQYCYEQWEDGFGATHQMVFAAISQLRQVSYYIVLEGMIY